MYVLRVVLRLALHGDWRGFNDRYETKPTRGDRAPRDLRNGRGRVRGTVRYPSALTATLVARGRCVRHLGLAERIATAESVPWGLALALCRFALAFSARLYFQYQNMYSLL